MKLQIFSGVVLVPKDGEPVYKKAFGYSDWTSKTDNNTSTLFNICSIGKVFTHAIILQLANESKLNLSDALNKYITVFPDEIAGKITIDMIIEMKAGFGDYLNDPGYNKNREKFKTVNDYLELIKNEPMLFEPGTNREYSNSGYAVLGGIIENVTGKSYAENLKERFFNPLGMKDTYYKQMEDNLSNCASGTRILFNGNKKSGMMEASPSPAGGIYTNADDLLKFDNELRKTKIFGSFIKRAGGTPFWNSVLIEKDEHYTIIILANFTRVSEEMYRRINAILDGKPYPEPELPADMQNYKIMKEQGAEGLEKNLKNVLESNNIEYDDMYLNMFGYGLMENGELDMAIEVFKLNAKLFPGIANVFDSLGEAYMNKGNKELAIENYKKVVELQPGNKHAKEMLDKLNR
jgi:tetratricopeptide (TPR) repeat protein